MRSFSALLIWLGMSAFVENDWGHTLEYCINAYCLQCIGILALNVILLTLAICERRFCNISILSFHFVSVF